MDRENLFFFFFQKKKWESWLFIQWSSSRFKELQ